MNKLDEQEVKLRQYITRVFLTTGAAPKSKEIEKQFGLSENETIAVLKSLSEQKGLVLHPHIPEIWIAHPFSNAPNSFWIETKDSKQGWWSNCAWCAMGVSSLVKKDVTITSRWGGEREHFEIEIRNGKLSFSDFVVHMALPVGRLWDNVLYSCSLMLPHKSDNHLDEWCKRHQIRKGSALKANKCLELSQKWYGTYLEANWNRKSAEEVRIFFNSIGLDLNFDELTSIAI